MSGFQPSNSEMDEDNHSDAIAAREVTNVMFPNQTIGQNKLTVKYKVNVYMKGSKLTVSFAIS